MSLNLLEHQRSVINALGIDIWIPKNGIETYAYTPGLFRDQVEDEPKDLTQFQLTKNNEHSTTESRLQPVQILTKKAEVEVVIQTEQQSRIQTDLSTEVQSKTEVDEPIVIAPFTIQALFTEHSMILLETTELSNSELKLWQSIHQILNAELSELNWPFNFPQFQDGRGVEVYLNGFIDAFRCDRKVFILGEIAYLNLANITQLDPLKTLINQPLLKRNVWKLIHS